MLTAALFMIAKMWKQLKCLSTDEWIKKLWYIYTMDTTQPEKRNFTFATWMCPESIRVSEKSQRETNTACYHLYMEFKK